MNILVGQSGGPTAVINASLYGVIAQTFHYTDIKKVYGMVNGIEGFLNDQLVDLKKELSQKDMQLLRNTPSSYLGSCRYKLPEDLDDEVYPHLFKKFHEYNIQCVFYIGGNDSMDTISKLARYGTKVDSPIRFIGIPKTIDNDLIETDHTPGYGSVAKYVGSAVRNITWDAGVYKQPSVTIIELMGRHAGWITAAAVLARTEYEKNPMLIYLPESVFDIEKFVEDVNACLEKQNTVIVCVSEGIKDADGQFIAGSGGLDRFGHTMLSGSGKVLERIVKERIGCKCRSIEVNLLQRCSNLLQSLTDRNEAEEAGRVAVSYAHKGETGQMVCFKRGEGEYHVTYELTPVDAIANQEKSFPDEWIIDGKDIAPEFIEYVNPLIEGEVKVDYQNGLPLLLRPLYKK